MISKEDILEREGFDFDAFKYENEYSAKAILNAMSFYAKEVAISFKEWQDENTEGKIWEQYDGHDTWYNGFTKEVIETPELFERFKSQTNAGQ